MNNILKKSYLGFTDNIKPMQKARMENTLDNLIRYNGKVMSTKDYVYNRLLEGYRPGLEENYSYWSNRLNDYTKPKTLYKLETNNTYIEVTKTEYEFALHIINNGFLDDNTLTNYIENEQEILKQQEEARIKQEEKEKRQREIERQKEKEESDRIRQEKIAKWTKIGNNIITEDVKEIVITAIDNQWNNILERYPDTNKDELIEKYMNILPQNLGNIAYVTSQLHFLYHDEINKEYIKTSINMQIEMYILSKVFNIDPSDSKQTITAKVKAIHENRQYKGSTPVKIEEFYVYNHITKTFDSVTGQKTKVKGLECFVYEDNNGKYRIVETVSGQTITTDTSKTKVIEKVKEYIENKKEQLEQAINQAIEKYGKSPKVA